MASKTITITLYMSELIYDVQNKTWLTGRSRKSGDNHEAVADMQAGDEDSDQIMRSIGNAYATLKNQLSEYLSEDKTTANNILLIDTSNLSIALNMPSNYNEVTRETITADAHQYLVNSAIGDWFTITNKEDAKNYFDLAGIALKEIIEAINKRVRPKRTEVKSDNT